MDQETQDLWHIFELTALDLWRSGGQSPNRVLGRIEEVFAIRRLPAFANPVHWQIYRRLEGPADSVLYVGVRREWNAYADRQQQFATPLEIVKYIYRGKIAPTIIDQTFDVDPKFIIPLLTTIEAQPVPVLRPTALFGCDGVTTELTIGDFWAGITLNWWGPGPDAWRSITEITEQTYLRLEELAAAAGREHDGVKES